MDDLASILFGVICMARMLLCQFCCVLAVCAYCWNLISGITILFLWPFEIPICFARFQETVDNLLRTSLHDHECMVHTRLLTKAAVHIWPRERILKILFFSIVKCLFSLHSLRSQYPVHFCSLLDTKFNCLLVLKRWSTEVTITDELWASNI